MWWLDRTDLWPLTGTVKDADNFDRLFSCAVDKHERETANREFPSAGLASCAATERNFFPCVDCCLDNHRSAAGLCSAKELCCVVADMR